MSTSRKIAVFLRSSFPQIWMSWKYDSYQNKCGVMTRSGRPKKLLNIDQYKGRVLGQALKCNAIWCFTGCWSAWARIPSDHCCWSVWYSLTSTLFSLLIPHTIMTPSRKELTHLFYLIEQVMFLISQEAKAFEQCWKWTLHFCPGALFLHCLHKPDIGIDLYINNTARHICWLFTLTLLTWLLISA